MYATELQEMLAIHKPTFVILTETKLTHGKEARASVRTAFGNDFVMHKLQLTIT